MATHIEGYGFTHNGSVFTPDGKCADGMSQADVARVNIETEAKEIAWLKTHPDRCTLYCNTSPVSGLATGNITTWLGTVLASNVVFGPRAYSNLNHWAIRATYRRSVTCELFGVRYHGWFMESSGSYCRLRKFKATSKSAK